MEITIQINGQALPVEVSIEVYTYLNKATTRTKTSPMSNDGIGICESLTSTLSPKSVAAVTY